jgi:tetratricopeptide (TPR) repeat protein
MMEIGEFAWAEVFLEEALEGALVSGDERLRAEALLTRLLVRHNATEDLDGWRAEVQRETAQLIPLLEEREAHPELARAWRMVAFIHGIACEWEATAAAEEKAIRYARLAGLIREETRLSGPYAIALCFGPTHVSDAIIRCQELLARGLDQRQAEAQIHGSLAILHAMKGDFPRAREHYRQARTMLEDVGAVVLGAEAALAAGRVELLAGSFDLAEAELRRCHERLVELGELYYRPTIAGLLAQALYAQGRLPEAEALATDAATIAAEDDIDAQALWRSVMAKILAARGRLDEAVGVARDAVAVLSATDDVYARAEAWLDLADVSLAAGDGSGARNAAAAAAELCQLKGITALSARVALASGAVGTQRGAVAG